MNTHRFELSVRVLIYREDDAFVAHALELDLLGYGDTVEAAREDLEELMKCQMEVAVQERDSELLDFPAPAEFFQRWETAHARALRGGLKSDDVAESFEAIAIFTPIGDLLESARAVGSTSRYELSPESSFA